jgi:hypothetical protein
LVNRLALSLTLRKIIVKVDVCWIVLFAEVPGLLETVARVFEEFVIAQFACDELGMGDYPGQAVGRKCGFGFGVLMNGLLIGPGNEILGRRRSVVRNVRCIVGGEILPKSGDLSSVFCLLV